METYTLSAFPSAYSTIHIALFRNVTNAPEIRKRLIRASTLEGDVGDKARAEIDFGFIEASLLVSRLHLLTAISTTLLTAFPTPLQTPSSSTSTNDPSLSSSSTTTSTSTSSSSDTQNPIKSPLPPSSSPTIQPQTRSHNLHSEILLSLSPNNNITDSIRRHGLSDTTSFLAVVRFGPPTSPPYEVYEAIKVVVDGQLVSLNELGQGDNLDKSKVDKIYKLGELTQLNLSPENLVKQKEAVIVSSIATKPVT